MPSEPKVSVPSADMSAGTIFARVWSPDVEAGVALFVEDQAEIVRALIASRAKAEILKREVAIENSLVRVGEEGVG